MRSHVTNKDGASTRKNNIDPSMSRINREHEKLDGHSPSNMLIARQKKDTYQLKVSTYENMTNVSSNNGDRSSK